MNCLLIPKQVSGPETDVLTSYQRRTGPSRALTQDRQDRLRAFGDTLYTVPLPRSTPSLSASLPISRTSSLLSSVTDGNLSKHRAPRGAHKKDIDAKSLSWYPSNVKKVLTYARRTLVNDMINKLGWPYGKTARNAYNVSIQEAMLQANNALHERKWLEFCILHTNIW